MEKYKLILCILIIVSLLLSACDDFLSPVIQIFNINETDNCIKTNSEQELEQKEINLCR